MISRLRAFLNRDAEKYAAEKQRRAIRRLAASDPTYNPPDLWEVLPSPYSAEIAALHEELEDAIASSIRDMIVQRQPSFLLDGHIEPEPLVQILQRLEKSRKIGESWDEVLHLHTTNLEDRVTELEKHHGLNTYQETTNKKIKAMSKCIHGARDHMIAVERKVFDALNSQAHMQYALQAREPNAFSNKPSEPESLVDILQRHQDLINSIKGYMHGQCDNADVLARVDELDGKIEQRTESLKAGGELLAETLSNFEQQRGSIVEDIAAMQSRILELEARETQAYVLQRYRNDDANQAFIVGDDDIIKVFTGMDFTAYSPLDNAECVTIDVNDKAVVMPSKDALGIDIKHYAGLAGGDMQYNSLVHGPRVKEQFVLQVDLPNGTSRIIGDEDKVTLHEGMAFTAYGASDNA